MNGRYFIVSLLWALFATNLYWFHDSLNYVASTKRFIDSLEGRISDLDKHNESNYIFLKKLLIGRGIEDIEALSFYQFNRINKKVVELKYFELSIDDDGIVVGAELKDSRKHDGVDQYSLPYYSRNVKRVGHWLDLRNSVRSLNRAYMNSFIYLLIISPVLLVVLVKRARGSNDGTSKLLEAIVITILVQIPIILLIVYSISSGLSEGIYLG